MKKQAALKTMLLGFLMAMLCACSGNRGNDSAFTPIYIHADDSFTDGTARQILQHNELGKTLHVW